MPITVDMEGVQAWGSLLPAGFYSVKIAEIKQDQKTGEGTFPYLSLELTVTEGPFAGSPINFQVVSFHPNAKGKLKQFLEAVTGMSWDRNGMALEPADLVGLNLKVAVIQRDYKKADGSWAKNNSVETWLKKDADTANMAPPSNPAPPGGMQNWPEGQAQPSGPEPF